MSWDSYIDNLCAQSQYHVDQAAIFGINGGKWTTDNHPNVSLNQIQLNLLSYKVFIFSVIVVIDESLNLSYSQVVFRNVLILWRIYNILLHLKYSIESEFT